MNSTLKTFLLSFGTMLAGAVVGFFGTRYWRKRDRMQKMIDRRAASSALTLDKVLELESQLAQLKLTVTPITDAMQQLLIKKLTHFHTPILDALMQRALSGIITPEENAKMERLLVEREKELDTEVNEYERICARILPDVIRLVILSHDEETDPAALQLLVVSVPVVTDEAPSGSGEPK
jgi:hypothetical protein